MQNNNFPTVLSLIKSLKNQGVPEKQYMSKIDWLLELKARKFLVPLTGTFELTPLCNLDCKMCYIHLNKNQVKDNKFLSLDSWKYIMFEAHKLGMIKATLTGGECLLSPFFDDLYLFLRSMGIRIYIMSNGLLMNKNRIDFFKKYPPRLIQITLYGGSDDDYEKVTGKRVFNTIYNNLIELRNANLPIFISITPNRFLQEQNEIHLLLEKVKELHIPFNINSRLMKPRSNTGRQREDLTSEQYISIYSLRNELEYIDTIRNDLIDLPSENHNGNKRFGLECGGGKSSFTIQFDGTMSPCIGLYDSIAKPLETSFLDAWKQINKIAENYPLPEECGNCIYHKKCIRCPAMHKEAPIAGHCDPQICTHIKKLIQAGIINAPKNEIINS